MCGMEVWSEEAGQLDEAQVRVPEKSRTLSHGLAAEFP